MIFPRLIGWRVKEAVVIDELAIINKVLAGEGRAFQPLVETYSPLVFTAVAKIVGDRTVAEDIAQEAFLQAYRSLASFRGEATFSTWLTRIAVNKAIDYCRRQRSQPKLEPIPATQASCEPGPELELMAKENAWQLREQIQGLPAIYRRAIMQYYFLDLSYREIAESEGISIKTVESRLYRARTILRENIEGGDGNVSAP